MIHYTPRRAAEFTGASTYTTGKKCKHGHAARRFTCNGACVECNRLKMIGERNERMERGSKAIPSKAAEKLLTDR